MKVELYSGFKKRYNSTLQPDNGGTVEDCTLKDDCSVEAPVLQMNYGVIYNPVHYNYAYIPDFNRYYYVKWHFFNALWHALLNEDTMASFKKEIGNSSIYVLRASNAFDTTIRDTYFPQTTQYQRKVQELEGPWRTFKAGSTSIDNGCYIIGIIGKGSTGAVQYYAMTPNQFALFANFLFSTEMNFGIDWDTVIGINEQVLKTLVDPSQYIVSCKWFPFEVNDLPEIKGKDSFYLGWWNIERYAFQLNTYAFEKHVGTLTFPKHPQSEERGDYLNFPPYSNYYLYSLPFGTVELDRSNYRDQLITVRIYIDLISGTGELRCYNEDIVVQSAKVNFAVDVSLLQMTTNPLATVTSSLDTYGNIMMAIGQTGLGLASGSIAGKTMSNLPEVGLMNIGQGVSSFSNVGSGIGDIINSITPKPTPINTQSSFSDFTNNEIIFYGKFSRITDESITTLGKPLCQYRRINALKGYILPSKVDISLSASESERNEIENIMAGGFYYE